LCNSPLEAARLRKERSERKAYEMQVKMRLEEARRAREEREARDVVPNKVTPLVGHSDTLRDKILTLRKHKDWPEKEGKKEKLSNSRSDLLLRLRHFKILTMFWLIFVDYSGNKLSLCIS
jgi:hypothetical protein